MKKTVKLILVVAVITIISLMATSAYAYEIGDQIKWTIQHEDREDYVRYETYNGTLSEGENKIDYQEYVYEFEAERDGYYFINCTDASVIVAETYENGEAFNNAYYEWLMRDSEGNIGNLYYLSAGKKLIQTHTYEEYGKVTIEYYGQITDVTFNQAELDCLILNDDVSVYEEGSVLGAVGVNYTASFSSGKTLRNDNELTIEFYCKEEITHGKNMVTFEFFDVKKELTVSIYEITDFVESVDLSNIGRYTTVYEDYNGENEYVSMEGETLTVKFTDGTEYSATVSEWNDADIILPNGKTVTAYLGQNYFDEFYIIIAEEYFEQINCEKEGKMLGENLNILHENNMESLRWSMNLLRIAFDNLGEDPADAGDYFRWSAEEFVQVFRNITRFVTYYLTIAY